MPHLERIYHRNPSRWGRFKESLRSITLGPFNLKDPALVRYFGGGPVYAGVSVSEESALTYAAVWQAVTLIAGDVGSLPLHFYKRLPGGGKERYTDHPLYYILHDAPNSEMSSMQFREAMQAHILTWGNAYAEIERAQDGRVVALWPLLPHQVTPFREERAGRPLRYRVANPSGGDIIFNPSDILHIRGLGGDGIVGYSPIRQARQSLGLLAAAEVFGATFFGNGTTFGGFIKHPAKLSEKAEKSLRESINAGHNGVDKAHRWKILEEGMDAVKVGVEPNDAQFLETRQFQIAEVARWFNLPLHKLREMEHSSVRANIEQEALDYYQSTLRPWLVRWEQEIDRKLISPREKYIQFAEFNLDGVLRGDQKSRYESYAIARSWGWLSANEIRSLENMNPIPEGNMYLVQANTTPADRINDVIDAQVQPPAPQGPAAGDDDSERQEILGRLEQQAVAIGTLQVQLDAAVQARDSLAAAVDEARAETDEARRFGTQEVCDVLEAGNKKAAVLEEALTQALAERDHARGEVEAEAAATCVERDGWHAQRDEIEASLVAAIAERDTALANHAEYVLQTAARVGELEDDVSAERAARTAAEELARARASDLVAERTALEAVTAERDQARETLSVAEAERQALDEARVSAEQARDAAEARAIEAERQTAAAREEAAANAHERDVEQEVVASAHARLVAAEQHAAQLEKNALASAELAATTTAALAETERANTAYRASLITANRAVIAETLRRLVRREVEKARAKRATPAKLKAWAESFYDAYETDVWCDTLRPVIALHQAVLDGEPDHVDVITRKLVDAHMAESLVQIRAVADKDADEYQPALDALLQRWETQRPDAVADRLIAEEIRHGR